MPGQKTIRGDEHVASSAEPHTAGAGEPRRVAEPTLMYVIKQVELASRARLDELFRPIGLTALQYTALTVLARHPGMSSSQLARNSFVTTQSMADMVAALEARGLIERHRDASDRRRLVLALTGKGRTLLRRYRPRVDALERQMLGGLTGEQEQQLRHNLEVCRGNLAGRSPAAEN